MVVLLSVTALAATPVNITVSNVDTSTFPEMSVEFSAWDANGIPLSGLKAGEVFLQEDDNAEFHPATLQADTAADLAVALVLDTSGSMAGQPLLDTKSAAARFLDRLGKADQAAVLSFSSQVNTDPAALDPVREVPFSSDLTKAYALVENLQAGGETELYNAVEKAVSWTAQLPPGHRAVLVFTDGRNEPENVGDPDSPIKLAQQGNIPVFVIALGEDIDSAYLQRLTTETGGFYAFTPISSELSRQFNDIASLLKTVYRASYSSSFTDGQAGHKLSLRIATSQGEGSVDYSLPALPLIAPTTAPSPTITTAPTAVLPTPVPTLEPTPETPPPPSLRSRILIGVGVLLALVGILLTTRRRKPKMIDKCGNCGAELPSHGPCPICGSTKRVEVKEKEGK